MAVPHRIQILAAVVLVFGASHVLASPKGTAGDSSDGDWVYVDHDLAGTRYSSLKQITTANVSQLVKACAYSFPDKEPSQTAPIVSAGRIYLTTAHYTVAIDGSDCRLIWSSTWTPREHEPANTHRGAALADGKIIRGTDDGFLLALDAKDGRTLWAKQIADPKEGHFISMAPLVRGDLVYIGADCLGCQDWSSSVVPPIRTSRRARLRCVACCAGVQNNDQWVHTQCDCQHRQGRTAAAPGP